MMIQDANGLGRVEVTTLPLPAFAREVRATYTYSGKVLVQYRRDDDPAVHKDYFHFAVVNDDGSDFRDIFSGAIPQEKKANGIRHMMFADNKRILLGDYVLECEPDIDHCRQSRLVPVQYPWRAKLDPRTMKHWSEIIIAPDNEHIAWTALRFDIGAYVGLGVLQRKRGKYVIARPQIISSVIGLTPDKHNPGFMLPPAVIRGGEVKQFVHGGTAISLVGAKDGMLTDSVVQDLASEATIQITQTPGYDETTIFSLDEKLGLVMTTRGSAHTDPAIFGIMPRPHGHFVTQAMSMYLYMYAVAGVRSFRKGNIGPALIDIERSMHEPGYKGVLLNDPEDHWVYVSPMSWHPDSRKTMWIEMMRSSEEGENGPQERIRIATLHDYQPAPAVPFENTPEDVPYGLKGLRAWRFVWFPPKTANEGKIKGQHAGHVEVIRGGKRMYQLFAGSVEVRYHNYSDDGKTFFNGFEKANYSYQSGCRYVADVVMSGEQQGQMNFRAEFSGIGIQDFSPPKLLFDLADDGKPKSHGTVTYDGVTMDIAGLLP